MPADYEAIPVTRLEPAPSFDNLRDRVERWVEERTDTETSLIRFLTSWWAIHYKRPFKDPLLLRYTLEELLVEYLEVNYRENPDFKSQRAADKAKEEDEAWLKKMMGKDYQTVDEQIAQLKKEGVDDAFAGTGIDRHEAEQLDRAYEAEVANRHVSFGE